MSLRTEFPDDVVLFSGETPVDEEEIEDDDFNDTELSYEEWIDWHSEHLLNIYLGTINYDESMGFTFFKNISFAQFCNFVYAHYK